jgi:hypothetical protein
VVRRRGAWRAAALATLVCLVGPARAGAQQRPLVTEDPESIGAGRVLLEGGYESGYDQFFPASGLTGDRRRFPTLGVSVGISSIAEIQVDGGLYDRLAVTSREEAPLSDELDFSGDTTSSVEDLVLATKVRVVSEAPGRPSFGFRFGTKLPLAPQEAGLGLGTTDFFATLLVGKTVRSVRTVGNVGVAVLGSPVADAERHSALTMGASIAKALTSRFEIVGEFNGRADPWGEDPPAGTESRAALRFAGRYTYKLLRLDGGVLIGLTERDPSIGLSLGFTYVFNGFTVP